jgi:hypothetical protein
VASFFETQRSFCAVRDGLASLGLLGRSPLLKMRAELSHCYFDLLVNFLTAALKSSVCIAVMILCSSASSCCLAGVVAAW